MRQYSVLTDKKAQGQQLTGLLGHAAIRAHPDRALAVGVDSHPHPFQQVTNAGVSALPLYEEGRSFINVPARAPTLGAPANYATPACPAFPRRCPFGGACHTCPVTIQAKLAINQPGDSYEQEADWMAERVMRMSESSIPTTSASSTGSTPSAAPPIVHEVLRSPGQSLDLSTRASVEPRFGYDFSQVRVHTDAKAAESARALNALAYTWGNQLVFGAAQYRPGTIEGRRLIAHELTHVVKRGTPPIRRPPFDDQPAKLRSVLEASFANSKFGCPAGIDAASCFNRLDTSARIALTSLYDRLSQFGLWDHVLYVGGVWTSGVGGAQFTVKDHLNFFSSLLANARLCVDTAIGGMLHRGSTSVREISTGDSLHLSLSTGNSVSAHIDAISPVAGREIGGRCRYEPTRALAHIGREVVPLAIPGFQIFPEPRPPFERPERGAPPPELIRFELRF